MSPKLALAGLAAAALLFLLFRLAGGPGDEDALAIANPVQEHRAPAQEAVLESIDRKPVLEAVNPDAVMGRVLDDRGRPVPGARVESEEASTVADDQGDFLLDVDPDAAGWVQATHPSHLAARGRPTAGQALVLRLLRGSVLRGKVWITDAAGGRRVLTGVGITARTDRRVPSRTVTGPTGAYELPVLPGTNWIVAVELPGHSTWAETLFIRDDQLEHDIVISQERYREVEVRVLDRTTELPIEGAQLLCDGEEVGRTDSRGYGLAPVQMGIHHEVRARHTGYVDRFQQLQVLPESDDPRVEFELFEGGTLYGRVYLPDGRVAVGAEVQLVHDRSARGGGRTLGVEDTQQPRVRTDEEGWFRFSQLASRKGRLVAGVVVTAQGQARYRSEFVTITHDAKVGPLNCTLVPGADLWGTVRINGQPGRAKVIHDETGEVVSTDAQGRYRATHLPRGSARLLVHKGAETCLGKELAITIPAEGMRLDVDLELECVPLTGKVATEHGLPQAGVRVHAVARHVGHEHSYMAMTGEDGDYSMEIPVPSSRAEVAYEVFLMRWNRKRGCTVEGVCPPARVNLTCEPSATVTFSLEEYGRGRAPASFAVFGEYLSAPDQTQHWFSSENEATRSIVPCAAGKLFIEGYPYLETWSRDIDLAPGEILDLGHIVLHPRKQ